MKFSASLIVGSSTSIVARFAAIAQLSVYEGLRIKSQSIVNALENSELNEEVKSFLKAAAYHIPDGNLGPVPSTPADLHWFSHPFVTPGWLAAISLQPMDHV